MERIFCFFSGANCMMNIDKQPLHLCCLIAREINLFTKSAFALYYCTPKTSLA